MKNIYICGFSGVGKSTISSILSERLNIPLISIDRMVMDRIGDIQEYVVLHGLQAMRDVFEEILGEIKLMEGFIVDLSGGISDSSLLMGEFTIFLMGSKELILERFEHSEDNSNRFADKIDCALFERIFIRKMAGYRSVGSDFVNVCFEDSVDDVLVKVLKIIQENPLRAY